MRTARLVGPTADGTSVVLMTDDGEELRLPLDPDDPATRAALRQVSGGRGPDPDEPAAPGGTGAPRSGSDVPRSGSDEDGPPPRPADPPQPRRPPRRRETTPMDTSLSPRDIQTRIRAGESLEDLVASSGMDAERVERFAAPVLAEREHMALTALSGSVRRRGEGSGNRPLRLVVAERLLGQGVDADEVAWDAWKREDGQWQVSADYALLDQERHAEFRFDPQGRFSLAEDDDARWLAGERPSPVAAVVDRDDELALVRATSEPGHDADERLDDQGDGSTEAGAGPGADASDADLEDDFHLDADVEVTERLDVTEDLVAVLEVVPPAAPGVEEPVGLAADDPEADDDSDLAGPQDEAQDEQDRRTPGRDEAAEPTVAVVRHLSSVSVEVEVADDETDPRSAAGERSALDTLYDMLGGDGYAEDSVTVYAGLSDAAAVPVVDEHDFEPPAAVLVPADPGPDTPDRRPEPAAPAGGDEDEDADGPGLLGTDEAEPAPADDRHDAAEAPPVPDVDEPLIPSPGASRKPGRRKRASVPSWDEIMFGGPKQS